MTVYKVPPPPSKKPYGVSSFNRLVRRYKRDALVRNLEFTLSDNQVKVLTSSNCYLCNQPPIQIIKNKRSHGHYKYNGIDRLDNTIGYTIENSKSCCKDCNMRKKTSDINEFLNWVQKVYLFKFGDTDEA